MTHVTGDRRSRAARAGTLLSVNRNKESVALDFSAPRGRSILDGLIARSDVLIENFRPRKLAKLGLDYPTLSAAYPQLIYCSISGFGQTGRRSAEPGYDSVAQAEGGLMSVSGTSDGPPNSTWHSCRRYFERHVRGVRDCVGAVSQTAHGTWPIGDVALLD